MQRRIFLACAVLMTVLAGAALAADITGNWTGSSDQFSLKFVFKQNGETLTVDMGGNSMKITHEGAIKADEISLTTKVEGGGDFGGGPMTLKREK